MAIQGDLHSIRIPELFSLLHQLRRTGVLSLVNEYDERGFLFYHGNLVYATSKDVSRRLGHFLVRLGFITRKELDEEIDNAPGSDVHLGKRLVDNGRISNKQLRDAVTAQLLDIMRETMAWPGGAFHFDDNYLPFAVPDDTLIRTPSVLLEASRMVDEHDAAGLIFPEKSIIFDREDWSPNDELGKMHSEVLAQVDGRRTAEQIMYTGPHGPTAAATALKELLAWGAIRQRGVVTRESPAPVPELRSLPVAPQVPVRLFTIFNRPDASMQMEGIRELLAQEPMLVAKLLRILTLRNVEILRSQMTLVELVRLLGPFHLRCCMLPEAVRGAFFTQQLSFWRECWEYSQIAARLCEDIARTTGYLFPGEAFLAGLLHKLGMFLLLHSGRERYLDTVKESAVEKRDLFEIEEERFGISHIRMGAVYAEKWKFPRMLLLAIRHHHYSLEQKPANPLLHIINVARGALRANGLPLGFQRGANERFEFSLRCLGIERAQAMVFYREARRDVLQGHYLEPVTTA